MWSLPHVLPVPLCSVDSENGGGAQAEARKAFDELWLRELTLAGATMCLATFFA